LEPDDLKHPGFSSTKARTIIATAQAVVTGRLDLEAPQRLEDGAPIERLSSLRGIGRWTAEHVLRRGLGPPARTFFPATTSARTTSSGTCSGSTRPLDHEGVHRLMARWHPYASVVYLHLLLDSLSRAASWIGHDAAPPP
jgi:DNA-3-methyladenine glycosylase II